MFVSGSWYFLLEIALWENFLHNFLTMGESCRRSHGQLIIFENLDRSLHSTVTFIWLQQLLATKVWNWRHPDSNFFSKVNLRNKHYSVGFFTCLKHFLLFDHAKIGWGKKNTPLPPPTFHTAKKWKTSNGGKP